jgi:hypothetical protein
VKYEIELDIPEVDLSIFDEPDLSCLEGISLTLDHLKTLEGLVLAHRSKFKKSDFKHLRAMIERERRDLLKSGAAVR